MIYVSTSCVNFKYIKDSVKYLADAGFRNIELSGGSTFYPNILSDLINLKEKYCLNYALHNYFPPPKEHFVLNLASLNDEIFFKSLAFYKNSILLAKKLNIIKYGIHAGFFIDIELSEIGKTVKNKHEFDKEKSLIRFCRGFNELIKFAGETELYLENNVLAKLTYNTFNKNVFMLCDYSGLIELKNHINFKFILDIAHLYVSSKTLNLNFNTELSKLIDLSDYIHISDNDGINDKNFKLTENSEIMTAIGNYNLKYKDFTLEVYSSLNEIIESYQLIIKLVEQCRS